jgi:REP element-mobilizing transposase RayT
MPQSLVKNYVHIIFSTKHRQPLIFPEIEDELYSYIGGTCRNLECYPVIVGGYLNHVHILCLLSQKIALMKLLELTKANSSKWIKTKTEKCADFYWQRGYAAFSVNPRDIEIVKKYIENQKEHHRVETFEEEYLKFIKNNGGEYDERYVWD